MKRLILSCVVVFVLVFFYEWIFHGLVLKDMYLQTASFWRPEEEMFTYFPWLTFGQFSFAILFCILYARSKPQGGVMDGLRYGILMGLFASSTYYIWYAVSPYPLTLIAAWVVGETLVFVLAGAVLGFMYRNKH